MRQIIQSYRSGDLYLADVPVPALGAGGAIVRTAASLVSAGTERMTIELARKSLVGKARARPDLVRKVIQKVKTEGFSQTMEKVFSKLDTPIALGYSCAGTIVEAGAGLSEVRVGDRVACAGAGHASHAEYNFVPKNLMVRIPDAVSFEDASFTTVGAIAMQGVRQADVRLGERVVVIGLGLIGLLTVQLLKSAGCRVLGSDLNPDRCRLARDLGADDSVAGDVVDAAATFTDGRGADAVIITAATPSNGPVEMAAEVARQRGRVVVVGMVGMNVPRDSFYKKELELRLSTSYGPGRYDAQYEEEGHDYPFGYVRWTEQRNMQSFLELVAAGKVMPSRLITHQFEIGEALRAYELLESKTQPSLGIVLTYPHSDDRLPAARRTVALRSARATQQVGIGLIGAGNFAKSVLLPTLKRAGGVELVGICTATGMSATETGKKHDFAYATTDYQELLSDQRVNTVFIATQHHLHAELACAALEAGKHVFVEKPLCVRAEELEQYRASLLNRETADRLLMVGFNRRFSPHMRALREAYSTRRGPMVVSYRVNTGTVPKESWIQDPDIGGGRIIGEVCHFVDFCEALIGSPAVKVQANCVTSADSRAVAEDSMIATIGYTDGSLATIQYIATGSQDAGKERIEVFADGITAIVDDFIRTTFYGTKRRTVKTKQDKGFANELEAFLRALRSGGQPPIPIESMMRTTQVTFDIVQALRTGQPVPNIAAASDPVQAMAREDESVEPAEVIEAQ